MTWAFELMPSKVLALPTDFLRGNPGCLRHPEFDELLEKARGKAPSRNLVSIDDVGVTTAFLAHDAARLITGDTLYVDGGYHIMD